MTTFIEQTGTNNPFNGIDVGSRNAPTFADIDGDGDLDAVVGKYSGTLNYYENNGSSTSPSYVRQTGSDNPFDGINVGTFSNPTLADIDGDGDLDAVVGEFNSNLNYFKNTGSSNSPSYVEQTGTNNPFNGIDVGNYSNPTLADIDGDGDLDAVVGEFNGNLNYFKNTGSSNSPSYVEQTGTNNPFNGIDVGFYSNPTLADIDGDGDLDAVVGEFNGNLNYFENTGSSDSPSYVRRTGSDNPFNGIDVGFGSAPTFADIDGDGDLDAVVGQGNGNLNYFQNEPSPNNAPDAVDDAVTTNEDTVLNGNVLADNGNGVDSDPDGDDLTVTKDTDVSNGTLNLNADGTFDYTPDADFNGSDSFTYTIDDGEFTDTATVDITVNPVNDAPTGDIPDPPTIFAYDPFILDVSDTFTDADGDSLTLSANSLPSWLSFDEATGTFSGLPTSADEATVSIEVTAMDGSETFTDSFDLTVELPLNTTNNNINGSANNDSLPGTDANDNMRGRGGNDTLDGGNGADNLLGNGGKDTLNGDSGNDYIDGGSGNDYIDGGNNNDILIGGGGDDILNGGENQDTLDGGNGVDELNGGDGPDTLIGGPGLDILSGGNNNDLFVLGAGQGRDTITDFENGRDTFLLTGGLTFEDLSFSENAAGDTTIRASGNGVLAIVENTPESLLGVEDFTTIVEEFSI